METKKLILTSYGLTTKIGRALIGAELSKDQLQDKRIFLFHEPHYSIEPMLMEACLNMGFRRENILFSGQQKCIADILSCDYLYCTEGNTFEVMSLMREHGLDQVFVEAFHRGAVYIGASAGAIIAGTSVEEAGSFDRNFVRMYDFKGLGLYEGVVIPHCTEEGLNAYIDGHPGILEKYKNVYSVANDGILVLSV